MSSKLWLSAAMLATGGALLVTAGFAATTGAAFVPTFCTWGDGRLTVVLETTVRPVSTPST